MRKIGIMSMQRIYNYGSFLQSYGLKKVIENLDSNNEVSFVDYTPGKTLVKEKNEESVSGVQRLIFKVRDYNKVDSKLIDKIRFFNHKRTYAKRFFPMLGLTKAINNDLNLDVQVIGSDEVFNCVQSNINVGYSRDLFGRNSQSDKIISYAASFGNTTITKIEQYGIREQLTTDFKNFSTISVRDRNSYEIVRELTGKEPMLHVDPAIAYNYMELEEQIPKVRQYKDKYIVVYGYSGRLNHHENEVLKKYSRKINAKILCFGGVQECCDEFIDCTPFELLAYFRDAEAVITDTFHGTIFSIINNKKFAVIIRKSIGSSYGNEEKLGFLLEMFNLSSQRIDNNIEDVEKILNQEVDYNSVNMKLEEERKKSINYLKGNIL